MSSRQEVNNDPDPGGRIACCSLFSGVILLNPPGSVNLGRSKGRGSLSWELLKVKVFLGLS
ncbi:MAG: hypothetical protein GXO57_08325 [Thermodesulfobacteria bacterium]|nr:hypothetical protein [Thermodesulfobacteriota bacterium]